MHSARDLHHDFLLYGFAVIAGGVVERLCAVFPADLPAFFPWEFSWPVWLFTTLGLGWFFLGLKRLAPEDRPPLWRGLVFIAGMLGNYAVLQTHIDYVAQHMFFIHRAAHFWLHHLGGFLIALGLAGKVIRAGMPFWLNPMLDAKPIRACLAILQHKLVAPFLFVGLLYFWLLPGLHTRVMLDRELYDLMNWTMALNGIMFWSLIVDPRPHPPARLSVLWRALAILIIELPQMALGAILSLAEVDFYPVYAICGRVIDMTALNDLHYGGLIIWLPGTLMSFLAMIVVLMNLRRNEEG
ncbi:putative membrane protein [Rhizomicrobium palustre]|uniref:Putative membrane protein n=1 Tax=Rhizomicrobium palustre TaxID=189966 RepID=A0A846N1B7_9PROT|nr:cytochrome c oxidase assembly protein [Rhizomicrobium palustre]NIK89728.1 putative membrane protein [Rhizomicrobium palustre]